MAKLERWGKKYNNKRNWPEYNKQLVRYGTLSLSLEFVEQWDQYSSNFSSVNLGKSSIPTNLQPTQISKNSNKCDEFEFFPSPFPDEEAEEIKTEQIFINRP